MRSFPPLDDDKQMLVKENIAVVKSVIRSEIIVNERIYGFEFDDLFQEGCIWLCKAAVTYNPDNNVKFSTYAGTVVANGLRTYCRLMCNKQKRMMLLPDISEDGMSFEMFSRPDPIDGLIAEIDSLHLLHSLKSQYKGTVRKGIEALELKTRGYSGRDIADMYGVKPNLVGAWISRALRKLETNGMFIIWRDNHTVENSVSKS